MATLIPESPRDCSWAERRVFDKLERDLKDCPEWVILHSLGLATHSEKIWGESDFVILSTKGVFVVEVKGGRVECKDGLWTYSGGGQSFTKRESPWAQASSGMFAIKEQVVSAVPALGDILFGFGVMMPSEAFTATGAEIEQETLLDRRDFARNIGFYIGRLQRHWSQQYLDKHSRKYRCPTVDEIRQLRKLLRPNFESTVTLGSELTGLDEQLLQLTNSQIRVSRRMSGNARTVVRGRAGTGKTVLACDRAKQLAQSGQSVLFLCFNQLLGNHVRSELVREVESGSVRVWHIHALFRDVIARAGLLPELASSSADDETLFGKIYPQVFVDAALMVDVDQVDVVVVDEAQDVLTPENLDAIDILVRGGLRNGRWHLFLDPLQNIYKKDLAEVEARLEQISVTYDDLFENCRNTRQIAQQTSIISGIDMAIDGAITGVPCEVAFYRSETQALQMLEREVEKLLRQGVAPKDLIVLSPRKLENSLVRATHSIAGLQLRELRRGYVDGAIHFATMHAFKGLERSVVLAIDVLDLGSEAWSMLHYAGLSRARTLLIPFVPESERENYDAQAERFGRRLASRPGT